MTIHEDQAESIRRYLANQVNTSTPEQRLLMLFDYLLRDLHAADAAFGTNNLKDISDALVHAQEILFALRDPLDTSTDLGRSLTAVYSFCLQRLLDANIRKDRSLITEVRVMIEKIASANRTAAMELGILPGGTGSREAAVA